MVKKTSKKSAKKSAKKSVKRSSKAVEQSAVAAKPWHEGVDVQPNKIELNWLYTQLQRLGIRSIGDLENQIAKAE